MKFKIDNLQYCNWTREVFKINREAGLDAVHATIVYHEDFNELGEIAKNRNIFIGYEALAWGKYISDHRDAWEIVRRANHNNVGIILDSFHTLSRDINLDSIASIPKEKIFIVQIADASANGHQGNNDKELPKVSCLLKRI